MVQNDILNQKQLDSLQMSHVDLSRTEWIERFEEDIIIIHNPHFKFQNREPYRMKNVLAIICNEGSASGAVNLRTFNLQKNSFLIVLSSQIMESYEVNEDFKGTYIFMSERFLSRLDIGDAYKFYEGVENDPLCQFDERTAAAFRSYIDMSYNLMLIQDLNPNTGEALRLLTKLFFLMMGWFIHSSSIGKKTQHRQSEVMTRFLQIVKHYYRKHRDVEFYADKMNMSAKYMTTLIKNASEKSAIRWIEDYVILDTKAQLSSTMNTIQQIAFDLNFPSQSLFGRYFKRIVGVSPSDYRASVKGHQKAN